MAVPVETSFAENRLDVEDVKLAKQVVRGDLVTLVYATDPPDHRPVIATQALKVCSVGAPRFATVEHGRANTCLINFAADLRGKVAGREDWQEFSELSPRDTTPGSDGGIATTTGVQHVPEVAKLIDCFKQGTVDIDFRDWAASNGTGMTRAARTDVSWVIVVRQSSRDAAAFLVHPLVALGSQDGVNSNAVEAYSTRKLA